MVQAQNPDWIEELAAKVVERLPLQQDYSPDMEVNNLFASHFRLKGHLTEAESQRLLSGTIDDLLRFRQALRDRGH